MDETRRPFNMDSITDYTKLIGAPVLAARRPPRPPAKRTDDVPKSEQPPEDDDEKSLPPVRGATREKDPPDIKPLTVVWTKALCLNFKF